MSIRARIRVSIAIMFSGVIWSQGVTSDIRGNVTDASGAVIRGVAVKIDNVTKGWSRVTRSDDNGDYAFLQLTPADS